MPVRPVRPVIACLLLCALLAGCGADGAPTPPPARETSEPGIALSITGTARIGITG